MKKILLIYFIISYSYCDIYCQDEIYIEEKNNYNYKISENDYNNYVLENDYTYFPNRSVLDSVNMLGDRKYELVYINRRGGYRYKKQVIDLSKKPIMTFQEFKEKQIKNFKLKELEIKKELELLEQINSPINPLVSKNDYKRYINNHDLQKAKSFVESRFHFLREFTEIRERTYQIKALGWYTEKIMTAIYDYSEDDDIMSFSDFEKYTIKNRLEEKELQKQELEQARLERKEKEKEKNKSKKLDSIKKIENKNFRLKADILRSLDVDFDYHITAKEPFSRFWRLFDLYNHIEITKDRYGKNQLTFTKLLVNGIKIKFIKNSGFLDQKSSFNNVENIGNLKFYLRESLILDLKIELKNINSLWDSEVIVNGKVINSDQPFIKHPSLIDSLDIPFNIDFSNFDNLGDLFENLARLQAVSNINYIGTPLTRSDERFRLIIKNLIKTHINQGYPGNLNDLNDLKFIVTVKKNNKKSISFIISSNKLKVSGGSTFEGYKYIIDKVKREVIARGGGMKYVIEIPQTLWN